MSGQFFGKYRGKVVKPGEQEVPPSAGMLKVEVPDVLYKSSRWAMPCVPYAGPQVGWFVLPPVGANIWVEFEAGDPAYPVWSGCYWAKGEAPANPAVPELKVIKLDAFTLTVDSRARDWPTASLDLDIGTSQQPRHLRLQMDPDGIDIDTEQKTIVKLTANEIRLTNGTAKVTVTSDRIEIQAGTKPGSVTVSADSVEIKAGSASGKFSASGVGFVNGVPQIAIGASSVSINGGNLEVLI